MGNRVSIWNGDISKCSTVPTEWSGNFWLHNQVKSRALMAAESVYKTRFLHVGEFCVGYMESVRFRNQELGTKFPWSLLGNVFHELQMLLAHQSDCGG